MKVCRKCGAPLRDTDRYCSRCGARVKPRQDEKDAARQEKKRARADRKVHFRTAPPGGKKDLDSFEDYENRSGALRGTVKVLAVIAAVTAAVILLFAWHEGKWIFRQSSSSEGTVVLLQSEENEAADIEEKLQMLQSDTDQQAD